MPPPPTAESATLLTTRLEKNLRDFNAEKILAYSLSLSIGITHFDPAHPVSVEELLSQGDRLMYQQKLGKKKSYGKTNLFPSLPAAESAFAAGTNIPADFPD